MGLYRNGVYERSIDVSCLASRLVVPVPNPPPVAVVGDVFRLLPIELLKDRYNPDYDHYFPEVVVYRDTYKLRVRDDVPSYEYERTDATKVRAR